MTLSRAKEVARRFVGRRDHLRRGFLIRQGTCGDVATVRVRRLGRRGQFSAQVFTDRLFVLDQIVIEGHYRLAMERNRELIEERAEDGTIYIVDAGANVGLVSLVASLLFSRRVFALGFEPLRANYQLCARNWQTLRHELREEALADREDTEATLYVRSTTGATIMDAEAKAFEERYNTKVATAQVPLVRMDSAVAGVGLPRVDLIKLDIEGAEELALRGGTETIARHRPVIICSYEHPGNNPAVIREIVSGCGDYRVGDDAQRRLLTFVPSY